MTDNGLSTIPYLMGITDQDWKFWETFLSRNTKIKFVSKELQTGGRKKKVALWHLNKLIKLQDAIKRPLHPIILGGVKYVGLLNKFFDSWTIISSSIYMKTVNRQMALIINEKLKWESCNNVEPSCINDLFIENFNTCNNWLINKSKIS